MYADLIGVPFANRGRTLKGLDCYGIVQQVYKRYGYDIPEYYADYNDAEKICGLIKDNTQGYPWKRIEKPKVPCLIAMKFGSPVVNHTGVYIGNGKFIHTRSSIGVCIDSIESPAWKRVIDGFFEYVGEDNDNTGNHQESV